MCDQWQKEKDKEMNREDVIKLAPEAGGTQWCPGWHLSTDSLERFAALVEAKKHEQTVCQQGLPQCESGQRLAQFCEAAESARKEAYEAGVAAGIEQYKDECERELTDAIKEMQERFEQ